MNVGEQQQLRDWADRLCALDDPERRAMGRAISMLLDRIDELERELESAPASGPPAPAQWLELPVQPEPEPLPEPVATSTEVGEDTAQLSLRDRLRHATDSLLDRGDRA